jgi:protein gp37
MGVSVENEKVKDRIDFLRETNAKVKFLSCEPLIGTLQNLNFDKNQLGDCWRRKWPQAKTNERMGVGIFVSNALNKVCVFL